METKRTQAALSAMAGILMAAAALFAIAGDGGEARALVNCDVGDFSNDAVELEFLALINQYRADNGLGALTISTNLNRAAHWMSNDLGTNAYFDHTDSLGRSPYQRALDCGYPQGAGENLAAGSVWDTAQEAFTAWQNSPGHNANMLGSFYRQIGIARVNVPGSPYGWYWTTNFGATDDGTGGGGGGGSNPTNTPTNTAVPPTATNTSLPPTATNTPVAPTATPTNTQGGGGGNPTNTPTPQPTATPTNTPPSGSNPLTPPSPPAQATATPTKPATATPSPTATKTPTPKPTTTPATTATPTTPAGSLPLVPGSANLVAWPGSDGDPDEALKPVANSIKVVYRWNAAAQTWERYGPGLPDYVNNLEKLRKGEAYWVITK